MLLSREKRLGASAGAGKDNGAGSLVKGTVNGKGLVVIMIHLQKMCEFFFCFFEKELWEELFFSLRKRKREGERKHT
jgi:hypothetical protein